MERTRILLTGFGPFLNVTDNPSGSLCRSLDGSVHPNLPELELLGRELPVDFEAVPGALDQLYADFGAQGLLAQVGFGVARKDLESGFRLENRADYRMHSKSPDSSGKAGQGLELQPAQVFQTGFDLEPIREVLLGSGCPAVVVSGDAGGYVCERTYHHLLHRGREFGVPSLFVHLPRAECVPFQEHIIPVYALLAELVRQCRGNQMGVMPLAL